MSPTLKGLVGQLRENSGYISKIRKLTETLDSQEDINVDDLMSLWSLSSDLMAVLTSSYDFISVNNAWSKLGYEKTEFESINLIDIIADTDKINVRRSLEGHIGSIKFKCRIKTKTDYNVVGVEIAISECRCGKCYLVSRIL